MPSKDIPFEVLNDPPPFCLDVGHRATQIKGQQHRCRRRRRRRQRQQQKVILKEYHTMVHSGAYLSHYLLRPPPLESLLLLLSSSSSPSLSPSSSAAATTTDAVANTSRHSPLVGKRLLISSCRHHQHRHTRSIRRPEEELEIELEESRKCIIVQQPQLLSSSQDRRWPRLDC